MSMRLFTVALAAASLAACGGTKESEATATDSAVPSEAAAATGAPATTAPAVTGAAAATPAKGAAPTKEFMVGKWGEAGECDMALGFKADGTMDGPFDGWSLSGNELTMVGNPQKITLTVVDDKTMESRNGDGAPRKLTRCP